MIEIMDGEDEIKDIETLAEEAKEAEKPESVEKNTSPASEKKPEYSSKKKKDRHKKGKDKPAAAPEKDKKDEQIAELTDHLKRNLAEFDNFRKRTEKEKAAMFDMGAKNVIEKLLPVIDNFERGLGSIGEDQKVDESFANGMDMVYKQMLKIFEDLGVKTIETEGKEFDPNLHNAVMQVEDENLSENMIAKEFQKGYTFKDSVIRHSMVSVAK